MKVIKISILDDDQNDIQKIAKVVNNQTDDEISFGIESFSSSSYLKEPYLSDLYIVDIKMPNDSGFSIAERILSKNNGAKIIFCTAHESFVFDSYDLNVFYFVRKSHLEKDLRRAIEKYRKISAGYWYALHGREKADSLIPFSKVMYLHTQGNNTLIMRADGKEYVDHHPLRTVSQSFPEDRFCAISSSCVVNLAFATKIEHNSIILSDSKHIPISGARIIKVKQKYNQYLMEMMA